MAVVFKWHGPQVMKFTLRQLKAGVQAVTLDYHRMCRKAAGITNTGQVVKLKGGFLSGRVKRKKKRGPRMESYLTKEGVIKRRRVKYKSYLTKDAKIKTRKVRRDRGGGVK